jgi:hypothetical protein
LQAIYLTRRQYSRSTKKKNTKQLNSKKKYNLLGMLVHTCNHSSQAHRKLRQKDQEGYIVKPCLKSKKKIKYIETENEEIVKGCKVANISNKQVKRSNVHHETYS